MTSIISRIVSVAGAIVLLSLILVACTRREPLDNRVAKPIAEVLSPKEGETVPRTSDPPCPERGPCAAIHVEGRVAFGYSPFVAVAPLNEAPKMRVQAPVLVITDDGWFTSTVNLAANSVALGEKFKILVLAHPNARRLREGQFLDKLPGDVVASKPVTVKRTR